MTAIIAINAALAVTVVAALARVIRSAHGWGSPAA
jgi:hypothetical protein